MQKKTLFLIALCALCVILFAGCTFHFKATDLEMEGRPPETRIGTVPTANETYELVAIDILKPVTKNENGAPKL